MLKRVLILFLLIQFGFRAAEAQTIATDSIRKADTAMVMKRKTSFRDPKRATLLSAVFPGAGQMYNRKYWKLPIVYGGAFVLGYYIRLNHQQYVLTRDSYLLVKAGKRDRYNGAYTAEQLVQLREYWRRNRDLLIIISGFTYLLNIADAAVDAHMSSFDVSDDLSLRWEPRIYVAGTRPVVGIGLVMNVK